MVEKAGPLAQKMATIEDWLKEKEAFNELSEVSKETIIIDLLLTATHDNRDEQFWIGMQTCAEQLLAVIKSQLSMEHNWEEAPPLPPISTTIAAICGINDKAQKIDDIYMDSGIANTELAQHVVRQYEETKRRARNNTEIDWERLIGLARVPLLEHRIQQARQDKEEERKARQSEQNEGENKQRTERQIIVSKAKDGGHTLTPQQRIELEALIAEGGTKSIKIEKEAFLTNATGE